MLFSRRGLTLLEVIVVISMIGIFASLAAPSFTAMMRDLSVSRAAMQIAEMHRNAILLSNEHATMVSFRNAAAISFAIKEPRLDANGKGLRSARTCSSIDWSDEARVSKRSLTLQQGGAFALSDVRIVDQSGAFRAQADLCFMRQTVFVRYDEGDFIALAAPIHFEVDNQRNHVLRKITIAPSGMPRVWR